MRIDGVAFGIVGRFRGQVRRGTEPERPRRTLDRRRKDRRGERGMGFTLILEKPSSACAAARGVESDKYIVG